MLINLRETPNTILQTFVALNNITVKHNKYSQQILQQENERNMEYLCCSYRPVIEDNRPINLMATSDNLRQVCR
jgi:hypothetical protein